MEEKKSWDKVWDNVFLSQEWGKYPSENLIQFVARNFYKKKREQIKILEVGCGTGANIWYIARERFSAYGIDGSKVALEIGRERLQKEGLHADLTVGDIVKLPYKNDQFDAVIDNECIYANNANNSKKILAEIYRVLKPAGLLYSRTFSDKMYVGKQNKKHGEYEYSEISDGPLAGKGFTRLSSEKTIKRLYSKFIDLNIDFLNCSVYNRAFTTNEWIIIGKK